MKKCRSIVAAIMAISVLLLLYCAKKNPTNPQPIDNSATVSGVVTDKHGKPIQGVFVSIEADTATPSITGISGEFRLGKVEKGTHVLHFAHGDYTADTLYTVIVGASGEDVRLADTVRLSYNYYIISGRVLYNNSPVPGAGVSVNNTPVSKIVESDGIFVLDGVRKDGAIRVICAKSGVGFNSKAISQPVANDTTEVGDILLSEPGAMISGTVYDTAGKPMSSVVVAAVGGGLVDTTDQYGNYTLENVPTGQEVRIFVPGQSGLNGAITGIIIAPGSFIANADIRLRPALDLIKGNGMVINVNDVVMPDTLQQVTLSVYPTTNVNTIIKSFEWSIKGATAITRTTVTPSLSVSLDTLKTLVSGGQTITLTVSVTAINQNNERSQVQTFTIMLHGTKPTVQAGAALTQSAAPADSITVNPGDFVYFTGKAYDPFGGIDTVAWSFGDGSIDLASTDTLPVFGYSYDTTGTFKAVFRARNHAGIVVRDTVAVVVTTASIPRPVNILPANNTTVACTGGKVTIVWGSVAATNVTYSVCMDNQITYPRTIAVQQLKDTSYSAAVDSGKTYYWRVEATSGGVTAKGDVWKFTTAGKVDTIKPVNGLVAYYPFNGNANDESGNGNNGTVNGATLTEDRFGKSNNAYSFNGTSSYIDIPSGIGVQAPNKFSYSFWCNTSSSTTTMRMINHVFTNIGNYASVEIVAGKIFLRIDTGPNVKSIATSGTYSDGKWHHVAVIHNSDSLYLYIDSTSAGAVAYSTTVVSSGTGETYFGKYSTGQFYYNGLLDDIRIYDYALSRTQIDSLYHDGGWTGNPPANATGVIAYYPFNGNANDASGNGHNGTVTGCVLTKDRFENTGSAYDFKGTNGLINLFDLPIDTCTSGAFSLWINAEQYNAIADVLDGRNGSTGQFFGLSCRTNDRDFWVYGGGISNRAKSTAAYTPGWHHFVGLWGSVGHKLYMDGVEIGNSTYTGKIDPSFSRIFIGNSMAGSGNFPGVIDDVCFFDHAITQSQIDSLYHIGGWSGTTLTDTTGLVALYPFNGNANDESGNGMHGVVTGASSCADRFGKAGSAYAFDGAGDYIEIAKNTKQDFGTGPFSIKVWVKVDNTISIQGGESIILQKGGSAGGYSIQLRDATEGHGLPKGGIATKQIWAQPASLDVRDNKWHLMVLTRSSDSANLYIDGKLNSTIGGVSGESATSLATNLYIGEPPLWGETADFKGAIDDVALYNRTLSAAQIDSLYHEGGWTGDAAIQYTDSVTDIDGNKYHAVTIGHQTWLVENLRTTRYNDGTLIPNVTGGVLTTPGYYYFANTASNKTKYGALYNWYTVDTANSKKIAPAGWHVPTDAEWDTLQNYCITNGYNYDGTKTDNKIAKALAATMDWLSTTATGVPGNNLATNNLSGFFALPGGYRSRYGDFVGIGYFVGWWSTSASDASNSLYRSLDNTRDYLYRGPDLKCCGFSVRLVRD